MDSFKGKQFDPLDPFSDNKINYQTRDINSSKARIAKRRIGATKNQNTEHTNPSPIKRILRFFKELPEREDRRKIYLSIILTLILFILTGFLFAYLTNYISHEKQIEEVKTDIESTREDFFWGNLNDEEDLENYKFEIEEKYNSTDDADLKFLYRKELINLYFEDEDKNKEIIGWINEQLSYEKITTSDKVDYLAAIIELYRMNDMMEESKTALNELLNIPDDGEMTFGGETLAELKARVYNENT